ncbi:uncharacterized protein F5147DRAFT_657340 [Suillus discolor]|uniref:Uncharacterized protein n=1 Tax=Suillus discolor TaxID=1912936 RepID=A0A9P7JNV5_9AGAM|nr:uncharacterized protein F5147DRAFT_657340 [Suillus discolor]KAG2093718.1 hypothetical protein F5147DRAFT_657340 [Suillus discolor]
MVFYAYVKYVTDNSGYRYVITFASREVADEWWRAVSTSTVTSFVTSVQRVNAQFYTHNVGVANAADSLTTTGVATQFLGKHYPTARTFRGPHQRKLVISPAGTAGTVMIGSDDVVITLTTSDLSVNVDATTAQVILSLAPLTGLTLSTLLTNFTVGSSLSVNDETMKELLYTVNGEEWELA